MIKSKSQLSIVMPVYNSENFLHKAISSVTNQTFKNFVFLISDNSSDDSSLEICKEFEKNDTRIKIFKQMKNIGAHNNIKFLIEKVTTKFVMVAASDDYLSPDWVEKLLNIQKKKLCISYGDTVFINHIGKLRIHTSSIANQNNKGNSIYRRLNFLFKSSLEGKMLPYWGIHPTKIFREIYLKKGSLYNEKNTYGLDTIFLFEALKHLEIHQDRSTFLFKRDHPNNDHKNPENFKNNKLNIRLLNPLIAIFKIHAVNILWKDLSNKEKVFSFLIGFPLYLRSSLISCIRLCLYYWKKLKNIKL